MKTLETNKVYESPELEVIAITQEGVLCTSDSFESYRGVDDFEELF